MNQQLWENWVSNWKWIIAIANRRGWNVRDELEIKKPVPLDIVNKVEKAHQIILPVEFKEVLTNYSSGVSFRWFIEEEETSGDYREIFSGGSDPIWDIVSSPNNRTAYK